ncbi:F-box protein SKIP2-like [Aphidius gifuensis]|uniref:F-box protein SKIP2-like n=1 Tax=Aphidius gifuensis TaxID=684658 RepID=UPI001CDCE6E1|nr:F-box protein SKIP2-like [Aphidius gifuensis]
MSQLKRLRKSSSPERLIKKYKATSRIPRCMSKKNNKKYYQQPKAPNPIEITWSFNKKDDKTDYYHHDDASYAKIRMIMERVNDDCLAEIFMYVPAYERQQIALVCEKWKRALDNAWFNVKKIELTHWEYDEYPNFLKKNYPTIDRQFNFLKSLLYKCGRYLRELDLSVYPKCNILPIINEYCPNLEKLGIRIDNIDDIDDAILSNAFTNLSKLKVLKIIFHRCLCGVDSLVPTTLINSLLNVADTLTDLSMLNWPEAMQLEEENAHFPEEMTSVISQLKALKKFVVAGLEYHKSLYDYVQNSKKIQNFFGNATYIRGKMDNKKELFKNIEELDIMCWPINDDGIYHIANTMKHLRILHASCDSLTDAGIVACTKMNNLKCLDFFGSNNTTDSSIILLKNFIKLNLPHSNKITDESVIKVLENSPEMQILVVVNTSITHKFIEKAEEISRNRKRQLKIWVSRDMPVTQVQYEYLTITHHRY